MSNKATAKANENAKAKAAEKVKIAQANAAAREKSSATAQTSAAENSSSSATNEQKAKRSKGVKDSKGVVMLRQVKISSPFQTYFNNPAYSVSAVNDTGPFDILPGHKNFLTLLLPGELIVRTARDEEKLKIDRGIMHVHDDNVVVFLDV